MNQNLALTYKDRCVLQDQLPLLFRGHDCMLFTSRYEAWGLPVLEAMASGLAVVTTQCIGVSFFAKHGINALVAEPQVRFPLKSLKPSTLNLKYVKRWPQCTACQTLGSFELQLNCALCCVVHCSRVLHNKPQRIKHGLMLYYALCEERRTLSAWWDTC